MVGMTVISLPVSLRWGRFERWRQRKRKENDESMREMGRENS